MGGNRRQGEHEGVEPDGDRRDDQRPRKGDNASQGRSAVAPAAALSVTSAHAIESGEVLKGMTKEQVLLARGYPPAHQTPSTDEDRWKFWSSRFVTEEIFFSNGRVVAGRDTK